MNEVLLMDCMEYMKDIPDKHFDLAIVDPPYGIEINKSERLGHYGGKKDWDNAIPDEKYFSEILRISGKVIIWGGNYFTLPPAKCFLIWDKHQPKGISFADCEYAWSNLEDSARIFRLRPQNADADGRIHPTQKPVALYKWLLQNYAKPGQTIFDSHVGSGSIRIACHDLGFDFTGCELDPDYHEAQEKRFKTHIEQGELFGGSEIQELVYTKN
jgi:site-specific DNA-methyltransferase (adenine-specific)